MTPQRYQHLMELFDQACALAKSEQTALIAGVRASDPALADELQAMLTQDRKRGDLFAGDSPNGRIDVVGLLGGSQTERTRADPPERGASQAAGSTEDAQAELPAKPDPHIGIAIAGRYRLDARLGAGAAGHVYRARDTRDNTDVAIKLLRPDLIDDPRHVRRFRREFRAISRIDHPGCLAVLAEGVHEKQRYIVMEYIAGGNLNRLVGAPGEVLFPIFIRLAAALDCVHSRRIIRRDLKPANVLLAPGSPPMPKLADFGIVRLIDDIETQLTETGAVLGTIDYLAPEQLDGKSLDPRCDLYALGCVIYKLWADRPPFIGNPYQRMVARLNSEPPRLRTVAANAPAALEDLVARLLQRDPARRPQRASDVARQLAEMWARMDGFEVADSVVDALPESATGGFLYRPGLIGRDDDIAEVMAHIDEAATGPVARLVAVCGQGGLGKTALMTAVNKKLAEKQLRVVFVNQRSGGHTPFAPFPGVLAALDEALDSSASRAGASSRPVVPALAGDGNTTDRHSPAVHVHPDDATVARRELARRVADRLCAVHQRQDTVLILDDLHHAEPSALGLLDDVLAELDSVLPRRPVLIATMRPAGRTGVETAVAQPDRVAFITLPPLPEPAVTQIAAAMLAIAVSAVPKALVRHLTGACEGNPLLCQSAVRALVDRGHLRLRGSGWTLQTDQLATVVNSAVGQVLRARLSTLSSQTRTILAVAAVCGQIFDVDLLCRVASSDEDSVLDALDEAIRASVVHSVSRSGGLDQYAFEHDRLAEVLRADLDAQQRSGYHDAAGAALKQRGTASLATLAFHFARGRDTGRAFRYLRKAGLAAFRARDYLSAHQHLSAALECVDELDGVRDSARTELIEFLADALLVAGQTHQSIDYLRQLAVRSGLPVPPATRARWLRKLGVALLRTDDVAEGLATLEQALALLGDAMPRRRWGLFGRILRDVLMTAIRRVLRRAPVYDRGGEELAIIHRELGLMHRWIDLECCGAHLAAFVRLAHRLGVNAYLVEAHVGSSFLYSLRSRPRLAAQHHARAIELARENRDQYGLAQAELVRGGTQSLISNDPEISLAHFAEGVRVARATGDRFLINFALTLRGWGYGVFGRTQPASDDFRRAGALADELDIDWLRHDAACGRALVDALRGDFSASAEAARRVLTADIRLALPVLEALGNEILGLEASISGRFRDSVSYFDRARAHYLAHHLNQGWGVMTKIGFLEARLCLADERGSEAVPDLLATLRSGIRQWRRMARLPIFRGCDSLVRGVYQARRGNDKAARKLFARARAQRARAVPIPYIDTWCSLRIAFESLHLGEERQVVSARLDEVDATYQSLQLSGMRLWLTHMRDIYKV